MILPSPKVIDFKVKISAACEGADAERNGRRQGGRKHVKACAHCRLPYAIRPRRLIK
jgi:hypothetical protein